MERIIKIQNNQTGETAVINEQGGYMRSLHSLEEKLYKLDLTAQALRVLLFIRHETIRWDQENREITYSQVVKQTGIPEREVKRSVKTLENKKLIVILRSKLGKQSLKNKIGLNREFFGDLIEQSCRPKLSVVQGGKGEKLSTGVSVCPPPPVSDSPPGVVSTTPPRTPSRSATSAETQLPKEPDLKNIKKLLGDIPDQNTGCTAPKHDQNRGELHSHPGSEAGSGSETKSALKGGGGTLVPVWTNDRSKTHDLPSPEDDLTAEELENEKRRKLVALHKDYEESGGSWKAQVERFRMRSVHPH